jgi:hypothetical protein
MIEKRICNAHQRYTGLRKPKVKCLGCELVYKWKQEMIKAPTMKEDIEILKEFKKRLEKEAGMKHEQTVLYRIVVDLAEWSMSDYRGEKL